MPVSLPTPHKPLAAVPEFTNEYVKLALSISVLDKVPTLAAGPVALWLMMDVVSPMLVGASFTDMETTVVALLVTGAAMPSLTLTVKMVVSVRPLATRLLVGVNTSPWIAVCVAAAVPLKV